MAASSQSTPDHTTWPFPFPEEDWRHTPPSVRRLIQDFCHSVLHIPISLGAIQKGIDRVSGAIMPHDEAIAALARNAPVGYIDETPWFCHHTLQWLWTMTTDSVSLFLMHANRSTEAFFDLINHWQGILVSDGYGVYQMGGAQFDTSPNVSPAGPIDLCGLG